MPALTLLIKPASGNCNTNCRYCFYRDETDSRHVANRGLMSLSTLEKIVKSALEEAEKSCTFGFQGGEPLLAGLGFYEKLIEFQKKYNPGRLRVFNSIQTNGMLIDKAWAAFFAANRFLVGLSIDADKDIHDFFRPDFNGNGTYGRAIKAAKILSDSNVDFNILSVVTRKFASHPDRVWNSYKKHGFRYIQFIPCLDPLGEAPTRHSLDAKTYGSFLCRIFDLWHRDLAKGEYYSVRVFDNYIQMLRGRPPESCAMLGWCPTYALIEADGTTYPCDFYALDGYELGNIHTHSFAEMKNSEAAERFIQPSLYVSEICKTCEFYPLCRGGCRRDREPIVDGKLSHNRLCAAYKMFFSHALPRMIDIAKRY